MLMEWARDTGEPSLSASAYTGEHTQTLLLRGLQRIVDGPARRRQQRPSERVGVEACGAIEHHIRLLLALQAGTPILEHLVVDIHHADPVKVDASLARFLNCLQDGCRERAWLLFEGDVIPTLAPCRCRNLCGVFDGSHVHDRTPSQSRPGEITQVTVMKCIGDEEH